MSCEACRDRRAIDLIMNVHFENSRMMITKLFKQVNLDTYMPIVQMDILISNFKVGWKNLACALLLKLMREPWFKSNFSQNQRTIIINNLWVTVILFNTNDTIFAMLALHHWIYCCCRVFRIALLCCYYARANWQALASEIFSGAASRENETIISAW